MSSRSSWRRARTSAEALGIVGDLVASVAQLGGDVGGLGLERVQPSLELGERRAARERRLVATPIASTAPPSPVRASTPGRAASRCASASASRSSSSLEPAILVGIVELGAVELVDLVPRRSISRARARSSPPSVGELGIDLGDRARGPRASGAQIDAAEPVERAALLRDTEQRLVAVLSVQVDEAPAFIGELRDGREAAVAIGP